MRETGRVARFTNYQAEPDRTVALSDDHPAVVEGRTLFPGTVTGPWNSRRFLISGKNSAKVGERIEKGPWKGFPVFTLTLEERATCPKTCHMWQGCYGNAMQWARRNDAHHEDFIPALKAEVITLVRETCAGLPNKPDFEPPAGIVIRLHVLGDFSSPAYVEAWAQMMEKLPELHVFGYTSRQANGTHDLSDTIAGQIDHLNRRFPDRWVIRTSHTEPGAGRAIVVDEDPHLPDVIMCPASTHDSEACSTCALCWNQKVWPKTIAFLRHGIKRMGRPPASTEGLESRVLAAMKLLADDRGMVLDKPLLAISEAAGMSPPSTSKGMRGLYARRLVQVIRPGARGRCAVYRVFSEPQETFPPAPPPPAPARKPAAPARAAMDPTVKKDAVPVYERKPDEPLMRPHAHKRGGWGQLQVGSADQFDIGTAEERVAAISDEEKARIAAQYGAAIKKEIAP